MSISNFPTQLQGIIQQGFLEREFQSGLMSKLGYRAIASREQFPNRVGETVTKTRRGLKAPVTTPMTPSANTNFDNGLTPSAWSVEQYVLSIGIFADTIDLNMVTEGVGIASQFMANAMVNGTQAAQSLDRLARNELYGTVSKGVGGYLGGNTRVRTTLGAPAATIAVDDVRGFQQVFNAQGQLVAVSASPSMTVTVNGNPYTLIGVAVDGSNVSTCASTGGASGTLTMSGNVTVADGTLNNAVVASIAPVVLRPSDRATTAAIVSGDFLTMRAMQKAVATLRGNNVPPIDGYFNCYLDDQQMLGLFQDSQFQNLYRGAHESREAKQGEVFELLGVRYIPTTEAPQQASLGAGAIHRAIVCGQGALVEGDFAGMGNDDIPEADRSLITRVDDVLMVTREPMDRLRQIIAQSWYWIGGFALPSDSTANATIIPTATNSYLKRACVVESL